MTKQTIKAAITRGNSPVEIADVDLDAPKAGEILVRIAAAGVCHSDVHLADGSHLAMLRDPWGLALQLCRRGAAR